MLRPGTRTLVGPRTRKLETDPIQRPTTSFLPDLAHERATSPLFKASAFAFRSFPLLICLPSAFAPLGNKRHHHQLIETGPLTPPARPSRPRLPCLSPLVCGTRPGSPFERGPGCPTLRSRAQYGGPGVVA